ncbi:thioredoxin fold domain-containing protein [Acidithiobacillus sp. CV18-2]|uniref:thioredoxin fold domain-containing protein n=1 Tax=Acidithiobacillus caldus TaxID=33059 RepID=UPI0019CF7146|nr:thioredoxin fold domain-containing protein [Acidithiobacillus caldus]MBN6741558.1 thioredoxin fold domain-containing protein [Acidithiobacillus sp. MC6.1]MBU2754651.1 thioredoxin fold domain-containing protein [Acidithiobacillus sp. CV18-3]MBU2758142.1 thioredoxin fold domain-containing protein [Acidithiobacillus sp. BN09-2]MBU2777421.1 thioredoxin fold domain-containing protein [Acidithiobacillus sp. CV18-2]MBU2800184.1 thioredoxin fold domain-containing protein [Acidithiobacillus sp. VAN1
MFRRLCFRRTLTALVAAGSVLLFGTQVYAAPAGNTKQVERAEQILWKQILPHRLTYIQDGHAGPIIYDFQDPNCPYCHALYENELPLIRAGKLTVRYVPVAILTPESAGEAAAWLLSSHPLATLQNFETVVGPTFHTGNFALLPHRAVTPKVHQELQENKKMFLRLGFDGTPALLFLSKDRQLGQMPGYISSKQLRDLLPHLAASKG